MHKQTSSPVLFPVPNTLNPQTVLSPSPKSAIGALHSTALPRNVKTTQCVQPFTTLYNATKQHCPWLKICHATTTSVRSSSAMTNCCPWILSPRGRQETNRGTPITANTNPHGRIDLQRPASQPASSAAPDLCIFPTTRKHECRTTTGSSVWEILLLMGRVIHAEDHITWFGSKEASREKTSGAALPFWLWLIDADLPPSIPACTNTPNRVCATVTDS